jgi:hypothetical protein
MQHYWEQSHYRSEVGLKILQELLAPKDASSPDETFGVELRSDSIAESIGNYHRNRQSYMTQHPEEISNLRK